MPRYEVDVTYRLSRKIVVTADTPAQARVEAVRVVKEWQGPPFDINPEGVRPAQYRPKGEAL